MIQSTRTYDDAILAFLNDGAASFDIFAESGREFMPETVREVTLTMLYEDAPGALLGAASMLSAVYGVTMLRAAKDIVKARNVIMRAARAG